MRKNDLSLSEMIHRLEQLQQEFVHTKLKKLSLNTSQARALNFIAENPTAIQKNLADYLNKSDATTTNLLKGLEKKALLVRKISPSSGRQKELFLTASGERQVLAITEIFAALDQKVGVLLQPQEKINLTQTLSRVITDF